MRAIKRLVYRVFFDLLFPLWERLGFHLTLNHYYSPIPDTRTLDDALWRRPSDLPGIDMNEDGQLRLLEEFSARYKAEYDALPVSADEAQQPHGFHLDNPGFLFVDAEIAYCFFRRFRPARVIEIGSGFSTLLAATALRRNREEGGSACDFVAIEPYPGEVLLRGVPGLTRLIRGRVQDVPLSEFARLQENDILLIDSSHVAKVGSDVLYEYLEILPRLNRGVIVHVHDIFLPSEYPKSWFVKDRRFWNEQYLLQAFLTFNERYEVLWSCSYMHLRHPQRLTAAIRTYDRRTQWPSSFWMRMRG